MTGKKDKLGDQAKIMRAKAELLAKQTEALITDLTNAQVKELVHELKVHQIELETQNQQLQDVYTVLEKSRDLYTDLYENAPIGYLTADFLGVVKMANQTLADMLGTRVEELIGSNLSRWSMKEDAFYLHCRALVKKGPKFKEEIQLKNEKNEVIHVSVESRLIRGDNEIRAVLIDISEKKLQEMETKQLIAKLEKSLENVKVLRGLLPICGYCKKIRDDKGYWNALESFFNDHSDIDFSHGICPECIKQYHPKNPPDKDKKKDDNF